MEIATLLSTLLLTFYCVIEYLQVFESKFGWINAWNLSMFYPATILCYTVLHTTALQVCYNFLHPPLVTFRRFLKQCRTSESNSNSYEDFNR